MPPPSSVDPLTIPRALNLDRKAHLKITWADGEESVFTLSYLRANCPCASCKKFREEQADLKKTATGLSLSILPGNYSGAIEATKADLVGNYALRIEWSDRHDTGIYSFEYLRSIRKQPEQR